MLHLTSFRFLRLASPLLALGACLALAATPARAIPAFARKYGTSCVTCHTVFPKLSPFGEAFRRNGFRFPGIDGDYIKQEQLPLGRDESKKTFPRTVWPDAIPATVPLAVAVNGSAALHPDKGAGAAVADNGATLNLQDLVEEAHLFGGGSLSERVTFWTELTFGSDGTLDVEEAHIHFDDIFLLNHGINLWVGKGASTLSSFGFHSSYLSDTLLMPLSVTGLYGAQSDSWSIGNDFVGMEVNGVVGGRFDYSLGWNAGTNDDVRDPENVYGHVGFKLGGMRLDGEADAGAGPPSVERPWEETSLVVDAFAYRSRSHFTNSDSSPQDDIAVAVGGGLRLTLGSLELDAGIYHEHHNHALADGTAVDALAQYDELAYIVFPWLVPVARVELARVQPSGIAASTDLKIMPGVAFLIFPNLKVVLSAQIEWASGLAPSGGWGAAGGFAAPTDPDRSLTEMESILLTTWVAF